MRPRWSVKKLGEIAEISSGGTPSTKNKGYWNGDVPWLRSGELVDEEIYQTEKKITRKGLAESSAKLFPRGTVLVALTGATVGKTGILRIEASTNQSVAGIFPNKELFDPEFVWYFLRFNYLTIKMRAYGGAQPHIDQGDIRSLRVLIPPLDVQEKIVERLDAIRKAQELNYKQIALADELFQNLLRKELKPRKDWEAVKLDSLIKLSSGKFISNKERKEDGTYPIYGGNGILGHTNKFLVSYSTVVIGRVGVYCGSVHFTTPKSWITDNAIYVKEINEKLHIQFLYYILLKSNLNRFSNPSGQPKITQAPILNLKIPFPPLKIQRQIVEKFQAVQDYKKKLLEQKQKLQELFESCLDKAMKGELVS